VTASATYLYAISRPVPEARLADLRGIDAAQVRIVEEDGIACLVSTVELASFGEQALRANLEDLDWLQRVAYEHDSVVRAGAALTTAAPLRLATVCTDDAAVRARLRRLRHEAVQLLARLDGRDEWGVKLLGATREPERVSVSVQSGTAYLQQRKTAMTSRERAAANAMRQADDVYGYLLDSAVAGRRHRPQDEKLSGLHGPMLLNAAFLVERDGVDDFRKGVDDVARTMPSDALVLTGPWPPYSFATLDDS
jgi:hypothetical protein